MNLPYRKVLRMENITTNSAFSLRDYTGYLFPGIILMLNIPILWPDTLKWITDNELISILLVLTGGYFAGLAAHFFFWNILKPIIYQFTGDPSEELVFADSGPFSKILSTKFRNETRTLIMKDFSLNCLSELRNIELFYLCSRYVSSIQHPTVAQIERLITQTNASAGFAGSTFVSAGLLAFYVDLLFLFGFVLSATFSAAFIQGRRKVTENIFWIYYLKKKNLI